MKHGGEFEWLAIAARLWVKQQLAHGDDNGSGSRALITNVDAVAGHLTAFSNQAANDFVARALLLILILCACYAKSRAKQLAVHPISREIEPLVFSEVIPLHPAWLLLFPVLLDRLALCQYDQRPTNSRQSFLRSAAQRG